MSDDTLWKALVKPFFDWLIDAIKKLRLWQRILLIILVGCIAIWVNWDGIKKIPGAVDALKYAKNLYPLPVKKSDTYAILLIKIDNDPEDIHNDSIRGSLINLSERLGFEVLPTNRVISVEKAVNPLEGIRNGHQVAREWLVKSNADLAIWGEAKNNQPNSAINLHWTTRMAERYSKSYDFSLEKTDLPNSFLGDFQDAFELLILTESEEVLGRDYAEDKLRKFAERVRSTIYGGVFNGNKKNKSVVLGIVGVAYAELGKQNGNVGDLSYSVDAFRGALEFVDSDDEFLWVQTNINLSISLAEIGKIEGKSNPIEESIENYKRVVGSIKYEEFPVEWMDAKLNLANAQIDLFEINKDVSLIAAAVKNGVEVDGVFAEKDRGSLEWAHAQSNLSHFFFVQGDQASDSSILHEAAKRAEAALAVYTPTGEPLSWASAQRSLGLALSAIGERDSNPSQAAKYLQSGVTAFQAALTKFTRDKVPSERAMTLIDLGEALGFLGAQQRNTGVMQESVNAFHEALSLMERERDSSSWAQASAGERRALDLIGFFNAYPDAR